MKNANAKSIGKKLREYNRALAKVVVRLEAALEAADELLSLPVADYPGEKLDDWSRGPKVWEQILCDVDRARRVIDERYDCFRNDLTPAGVDEYHAQGGRYVF